MVGDEVLGEQLDSRSSRTHTPKVKARCLARVGAPVAWPEEVEWTSEPGRFAKNIAIQGNGRAQGGTGSMPVGERSKQHERVQHEDDQRARTEIEA